MVPSCFSVMLWLLLLTFFIFWYFRLLFLLLISFVNYILLLKGVRFVTFYYFFTGYNFDKLLFTLEKGQGERFYSLCDKGLERGAG